MPDPGEGRFRTRGFQNAKTGLRYRAKRALLRRGPLR